MVQELPRAKTDEYSDDYYDTYQSSDVEVGAEKKPRTLPSYHPTGKPRIDHLLDLADQLTGGRAEWIQRAFSYLFVGGIAAIINLITLQLTLNALESAPFSHRVHYVIAFAVATEVSILANFIPNDRITFSHLSGHSRTWIQRCARFHLTCVGGVIVTFAVSSLLHLVFKVPALPSQAVALIIATAFNFTFHHLFTYRHKPSQVL
jgi:putative flippase GtrA